MARTRRVEIVEIPVEPLSHVPSRHADRAVTSGRWSGVLRAARARPHWSYGDRFWGASAGMLPRVGAPGPSFWRVIEVRGSRLALVLGRWWEQAEHDDGHLRLEAPRLVGEAWSLSGAFRPTAWSRWLPVELQLSPRFGSWTLLELIPHRPVHPNAVYFRVGHSCLDRFVETLHTYDAGAEPPRWSVAANGLRRL